MALCCVILGCAVLWCVYGAKLTIIERIIHIDMVIHHIHLHVSAAINLIHVLIVVTDNSPS